MIRTIVLQQEGYGLDSQLQQAFLLLSFLCLCEFPLGALISLTIKKCTGYIDPQWHSTEFSLYSIVLQKIEGSKFQYKTKLNSFSTVRILKSSHWLQLVKLVSQITSKYFPHFLVALTLFTINWNY